MKTAANILLLLTVFFIINSCTEEQIIDSLTADCRDNHLRLKYNIL
jgi:hypothetical protein